MIKFLLLLALVLGAETATDPAIGPTPVEFKTADGVTIYG